MARDRRQSADDAVHRRVPLVEVDADYLTKAVKPKQFIHIDQTECIMCEGCVDICPWKCIHMVTPDAIVEADGTEQPGDDPSDKVLFIIDDDICTRCALCVDRCPTGVIILGKVGPAERDRRRPRPHQQSRLRLRHEVLRIDQGRHRQRHEKIDTRRSTREDRHGQDHRRQPRPTIKDRANKAIDAVQGEPGVVQHLPARLDLPQGLHRQPPQPLLRDHELGAVPPAPGQGEAPRRQGQLHAVPRWSELLPLHPAHRHRHLLDVLLPTRGHRGVGRHLQPADLGDVRAARAQHAPVGRAPDGAVGVPPHGSRLLPRCVQAAPRVQLGDRRDPAHAHAACCRSPAICCRGTSSRCGP